VIASIILAAGESRRMGFPKLMLEHQGKTLLALTIEKAREVSDLIIVVVGAYADLYRPEAEKAGAVVVTNPNWQEGLGSSLRTGIKALPENVTASFVLLADQPFVTTVHLQALLQEQGSSKAQLVFSGYEGIKGPPVLVAQSLFEAAKELPGHCGAKALMRDGVKAAEVRLEHSEDIDTPEDVQKL
jgi:molybdenum cofactor cytidylyltransferase